METNQKRNITPEDKGLIDSILFMKENKILKELRPSINFETVKEVEDFYKEEIISAIKERVNLLKELISELQKKGEELHLEGIQLLEIPLKIRVWKSKPTRKELESIYSPLNKLLPTLEKLKKEYELLEIEKEKAEDAENKRETKK